MHKLIAPVVALIIMFSTINANIVDIPMFMDKTPYVTYNGFLKVNNGKLVNQYNQQIQLKGISTHGIQWYGDLMNYNNMSYLKENWNINVVRIAMYTEENGYISNKETIFNKATQIIENAISLDLYVVIDWHTLSDNDPNIHKQEAKEFFDTISSIYKNTPNLIYEICNEPNGVEVSWNNHIKPYAEEIIPVIRQNSPNSVIIVGTPNWCKNLEKAIDNKLEYKNILYSCHFYSGSHKEEITNQIEKASQSGLPIIVSEWGTSDASGDGKVYEQETRELINLLNKNNISWINWSFSNKNEASAILTENYDINLEDSIENYLTESGMLVKELLTE